MKTLLATLAALAVWFALPAAALAANECARFASPSGSDLASGTQAAPLRTPQRLLESLAPGQTGCLRGGTYYSSYENILYPRRGGSRGAPLSLRSYPGERARLVGIIDIRHGSDYITLSGLHIEGTGEGHANTIKVYSRGVVIEDSDITNAWRGNSCLVLGNTLGGGQAVDPIVRRNRFHECGSPANGNHDHAIYAANVTGGEIVENLFYNSAAYTVQLYPNAHHTRFAHNVIDGSSPSVRGGVVFGGDRWYASSDNVVEQNVISRAATSAITFYWEGPVGTGNVARNNCVWGSGDRDIAPSRGFRAAGNVIAKPGFVNPGARDYRLRRPSRCLRSVGYDTLSKLLGPAPTARKAPRRRRLRVSLRPRRPATSAERRVAAGRLRRVPIMVRVRGASRGTVRISLRRRWSDSGRWGRPRVSVLHVRGQRRFSLAPRLRAGTYQARARVRDAALSRTAHSRGVRFLVP